MGPRHVVAVPKFTHMFAATEATDALHSKKRLRINSPVEGRMLRATTAEGTNVRVFSRSGPSNKLRRQRRTCLPRLLLATNTFKSFTWRPSNSLSWARLSGTHERAARVDETEKLMKATPRTRRKTSREGWGDYLHEAELRSVVFTHIKQWDKFKASNVFWLTECVSLAAIRFLVSAFSFLWQFSSWPKKQ